MKRGAGLHATAAISGAIALAMATPLAGEQPAKQLAPSEQQYLDAARAYLESESNAITADQNRLQRNAVVLDEEQIRQQRSAIDARIVRYREYQQQTQSWLDSITGRTPTAAAVPAPIQGPAPSQSAPVTGAAVVDGNNLTSFNTADGNFILRAYREWVKLFPGRQRSPVNYSEVSRSRDRVVIATANEQGYRMTIDIPQRQFRLSSQTSGTPITAMGSEVTGINLVRADYAGGRIYMRSRGNWVERSQGKVVGRFQEIERTGDSVTISDSNRGLFLVLRLNDRTINLGRNGSPDTQVLYPMSSASATYVEPQATID